MSYHPTLGKWMQRDPAGYVDGDNLYQYVRANPVNFVDPMGLNTFRFDGETLSELDDADNVINSWPAVSGRPTKDMNQVTTKCPCPDDPATRDQLMRAMDQFMHDYAQAYDQWLKSAFDYSKQRQQLGSTGPTPEGSYSFTSGSIIDFTQLNWFRRTFKYNPTAWGDYAFPLIPDPGTNTFGRRGMYIHGGDDPGSAGCIDLTDKMNDFVNRLKQIQAQNHTVIVDYTRKNGGPTTRPSPPTTQPTHGK